MRDKPWYPVVYMFAVTALFSGILIGLSAATEEQVKRNEQIFLERAVVVALGLTNDDATADQVHQRYVDRIERVEVAPDEPDAEGKFEYRLKKAPDSDEIVGYGVPIYGRGYWDEIRGVLGVKADRKEIIGLAFYEQKETPGLGAEIASWEWREQFAEGKALADDDPAFAFRSPGTPDDANSVYAVTGATQTSTRLERFMNRRIAAWRTASAQAQEGGQ